MKVYALYYDEGYSGLTRDFVVAPDVFSAIAKWRKARREVDGFPGWDHREPERIRCFGAVLA